MDDHFYSAPIGSAASNSSNSGAASNVDLFQPAIANQHGQVKNAHI
jgi:hypothetical protein